MCKVLRHYSSIERFRLSRSSDADKEFGIMALENRGSTATAPRMSGCTVIEGGPHRKAVQTATVAKCTEKAPTVQAMRRRNRRSATETPGAFGCGRTPRPPTGPPQFLPAAGPELTPQNPRRRGARMDGFERESLQKCKRNAKAASSTRLVNSL